MVRFPVEALGNLLPWAALFLLWIVLYAFVGTQMAWTLSPFIGSPAYEFILFRQVGGNFYGDVLNSFFSLLGNP